VIPRELAQAFQRPARLDMLLDMPPASRDIQVKHGWNAEDRYVPLQQGTYAFEYTFYFIAWPSSLSQVGFRLPSLTATTKMNT